MEIPITKFWKKLEELLGDNSSKIELLNKLYEDTLFAYHVQGEEETPSPYTLQELGKIKKFWGSWK